MPSALCEGFVVGLMTPLEIILVFSFAACGATGWNRATTCSMDRSFLILSSCGSASFCSSFYSTPAPLKTPVRLIAREPSTLATTGLLVLFGLRSVVWDYRNRRHATFLYNTFDGYYCWRCAHCTRRAEPWAKADCGRNQMAGCRAHSRHLGSGGIADSRREGRSDSIDRRNRGSHCQVRLEVNRWVKVAGEESRRDH
jgi:hypothetical protein